MWAASQNIMYKWEKDWYFKETIDALLDWNTFFQLKLMFFVMVEFLPLWLQKSKHQMMIAYHLNSPSLGNSELEGSAVSAFLVDLKSWRLKEEIA